MPVGHRQTGPTLRRSVRNRRRQPRIRRAVTPELGQSALISKLHRWPRQTRHPKARTARRQRVVLTTGAMSIDRGWKRSWNQRTSKWRLAMASFSLLHGGAELLVYPCQCWSNRVDGHLELLA